MCFELDIYLILVSLLSITFFIFISVFNAFNARCDGLDLLENLSLNKQFITVMSGISAVQIIMTYYGGSLLRTAGLNTYEWCVVLLLAATIFPIEFVRKYILNKFRHTV